MTLEKRLELRFWYDCSCCCCERVNVREIGVSRDDDENIEPFVGLLGDWVGIKDWVGYLGRVVV